LHFAKNGVGACEKHTHTVKPLQESRQYFIYFFDGFAIFYLVCFDNLKVLAIIRRIAK
jgi:hypothetical protein